MAKPYFRQVPNFEYVSRNEGEHYISEYIPVKNFFKRGKLREDIFGNLAFFEKYAIVGDERPDNVAAKFYDDPTLDWVVLLSNNILNIQSEWPLNKRTFDKVMLEKYRSIDISNMNFIESGDEVFDKEEINRTRPINDESVYKVLYGGIHHYETMEIRNSLGITVLKSGIKISPTWKTNGNFIETITSEITNITASENAEGLIPSRTVTVSMLSEILALPGDQITINGISEDEYNGQYVIKELLGAYSFRYELSRIPKVINPKISNPSPGNSKNERVIFTIANNLDERFLNLREDSIARYFEYWDSGLGYSVLVPSKSFVREVTNYEYEILIEENKRNIYVLKPRYLNVIFNNMDDIMPYRAGGIQYINPTLVRGDNIRLYQ